MKKVISIFIIITLLLIMLPEGQYNSSADKLTEEIINQPDKSVVLRSNSSIPGTNASNAKSDIGPLYGIQNETKEVNVNEKPKITIDKEIIFVDEETEVTITVTDGENPIEGAKVEIGNYASGTTDSNGKYVAKIHPTFNQDITVKANDYEYKGAIFSIKDKQGVVEITGTDANGDLIYNPDASRLKTYWAKANDDYKTKILAWEGNYIAIFGNRTYNDETSYFMTKDIEVISGKMKYVNFDGRNTIPINFNFKYKGQNLNGAGFNINKNDQDYLIHLGRTDASGNKNLRVEKDNYNIKLEKTQDKERLSILLDNIDLTEEKDLSYNFDDTNTGKVNVEYLVNSNETISKFILLNDYDISLNNIDNLILKEGQYKVNELSLKVNKNNKNINYKYIKDEDNLEVINVTGGQSIDFNKDLNIDYIEIKLQDEIKLGNNIEYEYNIHTKSGYKLDTVRDFDWTDVTLTNPNGVVQEWSDYYTGGSFYLNENSPNGTYTLKVERDLGPIYGVQSKTIEFEVNGKPEVIVDKEIIPTGKETEVLITVTDGKNPIEGAEVSELYGDILGLTDSNGQIKAVIKKDISTSISLKVNDYLYNNVITALAENEGVIDVSGTDINGNLIGNIVGVVTNVNNERDIQQDGWERLRLITKSGINTVIFTNFAYNDELNYYMIKEVELSPGEIKYVQFDGSDTIPIEMNLKYKDSDIYIDWFALGYEDNEPFNISRGAGEGKSLRVTPGNYTMHIEGSNRLAGFDLTESNLDLTSEGNIDLNWDDSNTGSVTVDYKIDSDNIFKGIYLPDNSKAVFTKGQYDIYSLGYFYDNIQYWLGKDNPETINIIPGENISFIRDLNFDRNEIEILDDIAKGKNINFKFNTYTKSGYTINYVWDFVGFDNSIKGTLKDPNGEISEFTTEDWRQNFYLEEDSPLGKYTLTVERNLGHYGIQSATIEFEIKTGHPEDLNKDGIIDEKDLIILKQKYGSKESEYDLNKDGVVDILDLVIVSKKVKI